MREAQKQDQPSSAHPTGSHPSGAHPPAANSAANKSGFNNHHRGAPKFPHADAAAVAPSVAKPVNSQSDKGPDHISSGSYAKSHHLPPGGSAPGLSSGDGVNKSSASSLGGYTSLSGKVDVIPGLDFTGDPMSHDLPRQHMDPKPVPSVPAQAQDGTRSVHKNMAMMLQLLQSSVGSNKKLSIDELAATLKVPIDSNTRMLLENLSGQLLVATNPPEQPSPVDTSLGRNPPEPTEPAPMYQDVTSHQYQPPDGAMGYPNRNHDLELVASGGAFAKQPDGASVGGAQDKNAGIKAALAQLLAQQGVTVKLGATSFAPSGKPGATSPRATRVMSDRGDGAATKGLAQVPRGERLYSQQTSYGSQMSISEGNSNSPPGGGNFHGGPLGGGAPAPPAETMSVRAKVQSFFEKSDQPPRHAAPQKPPTPQPHIFPIVGHETHPRHPPGGGYMGGGGSSAPRGILKGHFHGAGSKGRDGI